MPPILNSRRELFAQAIADGKTLAEAYGLAGFKANRGNAVTLRHNPAVAQRVSEILAEREAIHAQATARAIEAVGITKERVLRDLIAVKDRAMQSVEIFDSKGKPTGEYKFDGSVANRALELIGKELGMFIDRHKHGAIDGASSVTFVMQIDGDG